MDNKIVRAFLCILVTLCLLVNISPVRAEATGVGTLIIGGSAATAASFGAPIVILGIIAALGLVVVADQTGALDDMRGLVDECIASLTQDGAIGLDGKVSGWVVDDTFYVEESLVEAVRDSLVATEAISVTPAFNLVTSKTVTLRGESFTLSGQPFNILYAHCLHDGLVADHYVAFLVSPNSSLDLPLTVVNNLTGETFVFDLWQMSAGFESVTNYGRVAQMTKDGVDDFDVDFPLSSSMHYFDWSSSDAHLFSLGDFIYIGDFNFQCFDKGESGYGPLYTMSFAAVDWVNGEASTGLALDDSGLVGINTSISTAYPEWGVETDSHPVEEVYPVAIPSTYDDALTQTQDEAQTGVIAGTNTGTDTEVVPTAGVGSDTEAGTGTGSGAITNSDAVTATGLKGWLENLLAVIVAWFSDLYDAVLAIPAAFADWFSDVIAAIQAIPDAFADWFTDVIAAVQAIPGAFADWFSDVIAAIQAIPAAFADWFSDVVAAVQAIPASFASWLEDIIAWLDTLVTSLTAWFADVIGGLSDIISGIVSLPGAIADALSAIFIPSEDYLTAKVDALREKFGFIDTIKVAGDTLVNEIYYGEFEPPVIEVDLTAADGDIYWGDTVVIDFSWYAPYKSYIDTILSAFIWSFVAWRFYIKLPSIIGGLSGEFKQEE